MGLVSKKAVVQLKASDLVLKFWGASFKLYLASSIDNASSVATCIYYAMAISSVTHARGRI